MVSVVGLGLRISIIGLGVTFLALGLVILVMELLVRLFPADRTDSGKPLDLEAKRREETAVALAVGVALLDDQAAMEAHDPALGKLLEG